GGASYRDAGIPLLRSQNVHFDGLRLDDVAYIAHETHTEMNGSRLRARDVLLNITGASIGRCAFVPDDFGEGNVNQHVCIIRPAARLNFQFLTYCLTAPWGQGQVFSGFTGASRQGLGQRDLGEIQVPLPPLVEQQRITAYLDASCAAIDAAVATKRRQLETLDALRKSIIQDAVTRGVAASVKLKSTGNAWMEQIPNGWKLVCLKRIAGIQGGLTLGKQYDGPLVERPYLRVGNVQDGHLELADVSVIELPTSVAARVELRPDDVLMTEGGDLDKLGRGTLWKGEIPDCLHQNHIFAVRCFLHKLMPMFLTYVTAAKYGRDYFEATGKKTTNLACTNATKVGQFPIPLPPLAEQEAICAHLDNKLGKLKSIIDTIESQIATLTAYRKSLIHECVTGQRRITEAELRHTMTRAAELNGIGQQEPTHA
ncbi:restriction endonuclease subunit S, partial [Accumulibacter sp.]|uniref:restriction endonuclease subunit S n=1 Tax=Accumulibacter sp. TaxID=2053492 RepID=UPI002C83D8CB